MIKRNFLISLIRNGIKESPVLALLGARQIGKTTLARLFIEEWPEAVHYFDMEDAADRMALNNPKQVLEGLTGLVVIDEVQILPHIFTALRPLCDRDPLPCRFCLLGSASPDIIKGVSESLAGRIQFVELPGLTLDEVGVSEQEKLWLRGGFPRSFLAGSDRSSLIWRRNFIRSHVERDIHALGINVSPDILHRFWSMLAHYHGELWNAEELGRSLGVSGKTVRHYLDILSGTFLIRVLPPWFENAGKRIVKSPKIYFRDSGLLHAFLGTESMEGLWRNPKYGASWEGFAIEQILARTCVYQPYFWRTQHGAELDLFMEHDGHRIGIEFKCMDAPGITKSMHIAIDDLNLEQLIVVYPGDISYPLDKNVQVLPLSMATERIAANM